MTEDGNLNKEGEAIDKLDSEQSVDKEKPARNPGNTSILNRLSLVLNIVSPTGNS